MDSMRKRRVQPEEGNQTQSRMWLFRLLHLHMTREKFWILSPSNEPLLPVCVWQSQVISRCNQTDLRSFILFRFRNFCHFFSQLLVNFLTIDELTDQIIVAAPRTLKLTVCCLTGEELVCGRVKESVPVLYNWSEISDWAAWLQALKVYSSYKPWMRVFEGGNRQRVASLHVCFSRRPSFLFALSAFSWNHQCLSSGVNL